MFGAKGLGHDEHKNAAGEIIGTDRLLAKRNQDYLANPGIRILKLGSSPQVPTSYSGITDMQTQIDGHYCEVKIQ